MLSVILSKKKIVIFLWLLKVNICELPVMSHSTENTVQGTLVILIVIFVVI